MKRRRAWLLLALLALAGVFLARPSKRFVDQWIYAQHRQKAADLVETLPNRRPSHVAPKAWEIASGWAVTAYRNVCFSPEHVSLSELKRFKADLEHEVAKDVDLETIDWIWRRLEDTGPHGKRYVERFEPQFREHMAAQLKDKR